MELATITMPREEAKKAFIDYRRAVRERHSAEDEQLMRGYKALAKGQQVILLSECLRNGGVDELGRPRLAFVRADQQECYMRRAANSDNTASIWYAVSREALNDWRAVASWKRYALRGMELPPGSYRTDIMARAVVPIIPPALRPAHALSNYHILWEADWQALPQPRDPALLKHIGGDAYAVLAIWDVTPLEAAVLGVTRN